MVFPMKFANCAKFIKGPVLLFTMELQLCNVIKKPLKSNNAVQINRTVSKMKGPSADRLSSKATPDARVY